MDDLDFPEEDRMDVAAHSGAHDVETTSECPICFQDFTFKSTLPHCGHSFCFLCIKGVALREGTCPLCRHPLCPQLFRDPKLSNLGLSKDDQALLAISVRAATQDDEDDDEDEDEDDDDDEDEENEDEDDEMDAEDEDMAVYRYNGEGYWFYEARNGGWWRYERNHEQEIDRAFLSGEESIEMLIAGFIYVIDFLDMCQYRKESHGAHRWVRSIKRTVGYARDLDGGVKGIAGLRVNRNALNTPNINKHGGGAAGQPAM